MAQFRAFAPGVEVNGETVLAIVDGMGFFQKRAFEILASNGIVKPEPGKWYSQQAWLNSFQRISDEIGPKTLNNIGLKIPENANFPPDIDDIEKALSSIDIAYHMNHRFGEIGHYHYQKSGDRQATLVCENPYPCDFDRGIIEAMSYRFKPKGSITVKVIHDDACPCRKRNAESCTYRVNW